MSPLAYALAHMCTPAQSHSPTSAPMHSCTIPLPPKPPYTHTKYVNRRDEVSVGLDLVLGTRV